MDYKLKEPCPRPAPLPARGEAVYMDALSYIPVLMTWGLCNEKKLIDLGNSVAWVHLSLPYDKEPC